MTDATSPGSAPDRTRRRVILETRTRVRSLQLHPAFSAEWLDQLDAVIKPIVRVAMAEEASTCPAGQLPWIPAAAPPRCRPTPTEGLTATHDPSHAHREASFQAMSQQQGAPLSPQSPSSSGGAPSGQDASPVQLARRPSMSNVSGTSLCTVGVVSEQSTVWERGEIVARVVIEEGRTATVLREYTDFVAFLCHHGLPSSHDAPITPSGERYNWPYESTLFLVHSGFLLRTVIHTVEAAQTLDAFDFIQHAVNVLLPFRAITVVPNNVAPFIALGPQSNPLPADITEMLHSQAIVLMSVFFQWLDRLSSADQLIERALEEQLVTMLLAWGDRQLALMQQNNQQSMPQQQQQQPSIAAAPQVNMMMAVPPPQVAIVQDPPVRLAFMKLFIGLLQSEAFQMRRDRFFPTKPLKDLFARVLDGFLKTHFGGGSVPSELKKEFRPLTDLVLRYK